MNKKFIKKLLVAVMVICLSTPINANAAVTPVNELEELIQARGSKAPSSSAY